MGVGRGGSSVPQGFAAPLSCQTSAWIGGRGKGPGVLLSTEAKHRTDRRSSRPPGGGWGPGKQCPGPWEEQVSTGHGRQPDTAEIQGEDRRHSTSSLGDQGACCLDEQLPSRRRPSRSWVKENEQLVPSASSRAHMACWERKWRSASLPTLFWQGPRPLPSVPLTR